MSWKTLGESQMGAHIMGQRDLENAIEDDKTNEALRLLDRRHEWDHLEDRDVFANEKKWRRPLHWATVKGNEAVLRAILKSGCFVDVLDKVSQFY